MLTRVAVAASLDTNALNGYEICLYNLESAPCVALWCITEFAARLPDDNGPYLQWELMLDEYVRLCLHVEWLDPAQCTVHSVGLIRVRVIDEHDCFRL